MVNPSTGFVANWNNKPAVAWYSKAVESGTLAPDRWGANHQVAPLVSDIQQLTSLSFDRAGQVPRDVAYIDNRARALRPYLLPALQQSGNATLQQVAQALAAWDLNRVDQGGGKLHTAATFFDRWVEHMLIDTFGASLGTDLSAVAGLNCTSPYCSAPTNNHFVSVDNGDAPTMKYELAIMHALYNALTGRNQYDFFAGQGSNAVMVKAANDAVAELSQAQGSDPSQWSEPVESGAFGAQGAGSVPPLVPLPNRGSYGQVIEPLAAATSAPSTTQPLPNTSPAMGLGGFGLLLLLAGALATVHAVRRRTV